MDTTHPAITSFLGKAIPTFCYEIYRKDGKLYGHKIDWKHWSEATRDHEIHYDLPGKTARFILCADDKSITRTEALDFARQVHEKKFQLLSVELGYWNDERK